MLKAQYMYFIAHQGSAAAFMTWRRKHATFLDKRAMLTAGTTVKRFFSEVILSSV